MIQRSDRLPDLAGANMDALTFLDKATKAKRQPVYVLIGDEEFLKKQVREAILTLILGDSSQDLAVSPFAGDKLDFSTVRNELDTLPFIGSARVVIVENADPFVTHHRPSLERYVAKPSKLGVLILEVKTFPESTKLSLALPDAAKMNCKTPGGAKLTEWAIHWVHQRANKTLEPEAAAYLIELVGPQMGLLAQELEKLAAAVGQQPTITAEQVDTLVGRSRAANVFQILDAIGDGQPAVAFRLLNELFDERTEPVGILAALAFTLRKHAAVGRLLAEGQSLAAAMDLAGVPKWPNIRMNFEKQVRHLGRRRLDQLLDWVVELNLGLIGGSSLPAQVQLERLIARLAKTSAGQSYTARGLI